MVGIKRGLLVAFGVLAAALVSDRLQAAGGGGGFLKEPSPADLARGVALIEQQRFADAIPVLRTYAQRARNDADGHNWLAYAYRKTGQLEPAFEHYRRALELNPAHLGAHEYIGEAYLQAGQPEKARAHLAQLAQRCGTDCEQYRDLLAAIERHAAASPKP